MAQIPGLPPGVRPTPEQARQILQANPDLVQQLRDRIRASGLTPDQIRSRLRAEGYPEDLLDPYLAEFDTAQVVRPAPRTLDAASALGLVSDAALDSLRRMDSVRRVIDSLARAHLDSLRQDSLTDAARRPRDRLKRFGIEVFRQQTTQFEPAQSGPVDPSYRLGPGDALVLVLTGDVELAHNLEVNREGFIVIPQVGQLYVANLTMEQLNDLLYARLGRVYSGVRRSPNARTRFSVTVTRLRTIQVFVTGDVVRAGAYQISAAGTVLTALYAAGGPTESGSFRRIEVRRAGRLVDSVDVYDYLLRGISKSEVPLQSGDVIFVPVRGPLVAISGEVVRPAIYEMRPDETLRDLIVAAGGFEPSAVFGRIQIHRVLPPAARERNGSERVVLDLPPEQFVGGEVPAFPIAPGDSVIVFPVSKAVRGYVTVRGNVWIPGRVGFTPGLTLSRAVALAGGPKPDVYLDRILISRLQSDSSRVQLRAAFADSTGRVVDDLALQDGDEIQVFARSTFRERPWITIVGGVRRSGRIPYREGMTLRDAVLLADGLTPDASLEYVEIARLPDGRPSGALAQTIRVPLDSSYLLWFRNSSAASRAAERHSEDSALSSPVLQPYDNVLVPRRGGWDLQRLVHLTGQVKAPGRYALTSKTERLSDLLARAGGLTPEAYPGGIQFFRRITASERSSQRPPRDDVTQVEPLPVGFRQQIGIDLPRVLEDPTYQDNIILAAGDSIHIPEYSPIVMVQGAVNAPGPVAYSAGKNLDWYVRAAGGYAQQADEKRTYVTQPNGKRETVVRRFLLADDTPKPRPGALVYVPERHTQGQPSNLPQVLSVVASVVASLTTVAIVLGQ